MTTTTTICFHFVWCALVCAGCRRAAKVVPAFPESQADGGKVRAYPDPGHRLLGVYAGGLEPYFDYQQKKITLAETFPGKAGWWANLKAAADNDVRKHDVYVVYCGERGDPEAAKRRLDAWLKPEPGVPTYPELIPAVSLGEENEPSHRATLDALARHVRETYGIPVFQWYTDPLPPDPGLTADGWIWDSYRDSGFWVGSGKGYANSTRLIQRVSAPRALKELTVVADCGANGPQLAGSVLLQVARSGETPKWEIRSEGIHKGPLLLRVPPGEMAGIRNFDVHVTLLSGSGVELGTRACATLSGLRIRAR